MRDGLTFWEQTRAPLVAQLISGYIPAIKGIALDVGCGSAALTRELADRFERIIGLDIDHEAVHPQADRGLYLLTGDAMQLPLQSKCINFLFSYGALHHTQLSRALTEIKTLSRLAESPF